jgi:hypothetical protein
MHNIAILIGNSNYSNLHNLPCCKNDLDYFYSVVCTSGKYDNVYKIYDKNSDEIREHLRDYLSITIAVGEVLFYFTGHGCCIDSKFFVCPSDFDNQRPNSTGISADEINTFIRVVNANLVVKIIDSCNSGNPLIKSSDFGFAQKSGDFKNIIQIGSCLESQSSFCGEDLSDFTDILISSILRKEKGKIYYMELLNTIKDEFLFNPHQTPYFVTQITGQELFAEDASVFDGFRQSQKVNHTDEVNFSISTYESSANDCNNKFELLIQKIESNMCTKQIMDNYIDAMFQSIESIIDINQFVKFYDISFEYHPEYRDMTPLYSMAKVLSREKRKDEFVTAEYTRTRRTLNSNYLGGAFSSLFDLNNRYIDEDAYKEDWNLQLNCKMEKSQMLITFNPKFRSLAKFVSIVSVAPSLEYCFVFLNTYLRKLEDFEKYQDYGSEISRKWWKGSWKSENNDICRDISSEVNDGVYAYLLMVDK